MAQPSRFWCKTLVCLVGAGLAAWDLPAADTQAPKQPLWTHAFDLKARKNNEPTFTDKTHAFGVEVFRDDNNGNGVYLIETGSLAVVPNFKDVAAPLANSQKPVWMHGLDLKVRKAGEPEFTSKTQVFSLEVFRDPNTDAWIYLTEKGGLAVVPGAKATQAPTLSPKAPQWDHGLDLKCRHAGEKEFTKDTRLYSIEVFRDENNGNLIYISETGAIAVLHGPLEARAEPPENKAPDWMHGLDLKVRKAGEKDFTTKTKAHSLEVFRDGNNGNWIYLAEAGTLAVLPGNPSAAAPTTNPREPQWTHGLTLWCRKAGEHDFTPQTRGFGVEIFRDVNTGTTLYLSETGAVAAVATKN
jgi:hypothetical protein